MKSMFYLQYIGKDEPGIFTHGRNYRCIVTSCILEGRHGILVEPLYIDENPVIREYRIMYNNWADFDKDWRFFENDSFDKI